MKYGRVFVFSGMAVAAFAIAVLSYWALHNYEVLNKGQILPYTDGLVYEILIDGKYKVYVEPEIRLRSDIFNAAILVGVAYIAMTFGSIIYRREKPMLTQRFWFFAVMSVGMFYLAADELLGIHESIGHNLQFLMAVPGISHPDDLIIASYGIGALGFLFYFRSILVQMRRSLKYFVLAFIFFCISAIADLASLGIEELAEVIAGIFIIVGIMYFGLAAIQESESAPENL